MIRGLKYLIRVIYTRSRYSKYGDKGETASYFQGILAASFFVWMLLFMLSLILAYISPEFYMRSLAFEARVNDAIGLRISVYLWLLASCLLIILMAKKKEIVNSILPEDEANKASNYILALFLIPMLTIVVLFTIKYHQ
jgi:hypothetical protein